MGASSLLPASKLCPPTPIIPPFYEPEMTQSQTQRLLASWKKFSLRKRQLVSLCSKHVIFLPQKKRQTSSSSRNWGSPQALSSVAGSSFFLGLQGTRQHPSPDFSLNVPSYMSLCIFSLPCDLVILCFCIWGHTTQCSGVILALRSSISSCQYWRNLGDTGD